MSLLCHKTVFKAMSVSSFVCFFWREDFISNHTLLVMATRSSRIRDQKLPDFGKLQSVFTLRHPSPRKGMNSNQIALLLYFSVFSG